MLLITREAARAIAGLMASESADGVRIHAGTRRFARHSAPRVQIEVAHGAAVEETVLEAAGARVYLDAESYRMLDDRVLDADLAGGELRFEVLQQAPGTRVEHS